MKYIKTTIETDIKKFSLEDILERYKNFQSSKFSKNEVKKTVIEIYKNYDLQDGSFSMILARNLTMKLKFKI